ncbi:F-box protein CPR1-like [Rutidosis leptorrhynchoides]|uniref:F-box protein CPR1-like n=1 Tax=Rutidosis leptorrhynchoides TaxID=125765 RepID=UPI003A9A53EB
MEVGNCVDVLEQILIQLDAEDLIQCKSVCKLWYHLISSTRFVKSHLKRSHNNDHNNYKLRDRRIARPTTAHVDHDYDLNGFYIIGSCDGLVCLSPTETQLIVTNPLTREVKRLTAFPECKRGCRERFCWGFGYDSLLDDYKAVLGFEIYPDTELTQFYVLSLKSNTWKFIGQVKYRIVGSRTGVLFNGALYWFMSYWKETVIMSLDLCRNELKEIPQPHHPIYRHELGKEHKLVIIGGCLCIHYDPRITYRHQVYSYKTWVMNKNNSWQVFRCEDDDSKYDVVHCLRMPGDAIKNDNRRHGIYMSSKTLEYVCAPIFVPSLVSPHANNNSFEFNNERPVKTKNKGRLGAKKDHNYFAMSTRSFPLLLKRARKRQLKKKNAA